MIGRRGVLAGLGAVLVVAQGSGDAMAETRKQVPHGGSVEVPSPFDKTPDYPTNGARYADRFLSGYRNWRSTMSGYPECDAALVVGVTSQFKGLADFVSEARGALSIHWGAADEIPGQPWDGNEKRYPRVPGAGEMGPELTQQQSVAMIGWFSTGHADGAMYAVEHKAGVSIAIWMLNKHGGLKKAKALAQKIGASYRS